MHTASARYWEGDDDMDKAGLVHARICAALLAHRVPPGTQLNIRSIAKSMKVSPTPVREALIRQADEKTLSLSLPVEVSSPNPVCLKGAISVLPPGDRPNPGPFRDRFRAWSPAASQPT